MWRNVKSIRLTRNTCEFDFVFFFLRLVWYIIVIDEVMINKIKIIVSVDKIAMQKHPFKTKNNFNLNNNFKIVNNKKKESVHSTH